MTAEQLEKGKKLEFEIKEISKQLAYFKTEQKVANNENSNGYFIAAFGGVRSATVPKEVNEYIEMLIITAYEKEIAKMTKELEEL